MADERSLTGILDTLREASEGGDLSVGDVLATLSDRSLGAVLAALGLIALIPIVGAIPGVSILVALLTLAAVGQSVLSDRPGLWAPAFVRRRAISEQSFARGAERVRPYAGWIDARLAPRLTALTGGKAGRSVIAVSAALLAVSMIPLALVPWGVTAPAFGILCLGLALMTRDGALALLGYGFAAATVATAVLTL